MQIGKTDFILGTFGILFGIIIAFLLPVNASYITMALLSIVQVIFNVFIVNKKKCANIISFYTLFLFFSWFFHCGQIIKLAFDIPGSVPLDVTRYADYNSILNSFRFYFVSQSMISAGMLFARSKQYDREIYHNKFNAKKSSKVLIALGIIPRLYIDISILLGGLAAGYQGVYSITFPQLLQTVAFFFDAGCVVALLDTDNKKRNILFWVILLYKCITMSTGARQERIAFLIIWVFIFFYVSKKMRLRNVFIMTILAVLGILLVNSIGVIRASSSISISEVFGAMFSSDSSNILGNMLGEFGSALTTLAVTVKQVPIACSWGYGDSYLAGILSIVPTLATRLGFGDATMYISKLSGVTYFGGSYLGELYYNFSWLGSLVCIVIGIIVSRAQSYIYATDTDGNITKKGVFAAIVMISLILFVRGYFTDMVQKLVWTWVLLYFVNDRPLTIGRNAI